MNPPTHGVYLISVVAELLDMHPQTLRKYERAGFIDPRRAGALRLYSEEDIIRLRLIKHFVENLGLNLAGVELTLRVVNDLLALRGRLVNAGDESSKRTVQEIDRILSERYAIRVVAAQHPEAGHSEPVEHGSASAFDISDREAVEFTGTVPDFDTAPSHGRAR